jgi:malonyl-CoA/methylmalonyl-CoA synthetase
MDDNITSMPIEFRSLLDASARVIASDGTAGAAALDDAARRVAHALTVAAGVGDLQEARVAFYVSPGCAYLAVLLGIWQAGGIAVPLAMSYPPAELEHVIQDAQASLVVSDPAGERVLGPIALGAGATIALTPDLLSGAPGQAPTIPDDRRALILYTSGTTGKPKGVVTTRANIAAQIASLVAAWEWTADDRTLLVLPLHHVHGIINVVGCAIATGATLEIPPTFEAESTWSRLASGEISVFTAVPTIYRRLIASWEAAPETVRRQRSQGAQAARLMMSGSAALPVPTLERWREITGHTLLERYGMTEIGMALSNPLHGTRHAGRVGVALPGVETRIVDEAGQPVTGDAPGELEVRGPSVFLEYWRRPDETRAAFRDGWFRTGDVAASENGVHRLLGRTSIDIIKTGGYKVSALEIEEVLRVHPAIADCAVVGVPDAEWGERVCTAVELRDGAALDPQTLQAWLKGRLAPYKVPKDLRAVSSLPRNAMGKVVKPDVARLFRS